jgi:hypothetical protein
MKKISNREEANKYYQQINKAVDDFLQSTKSRPSETHKYLRYNGKSFLKRLEIEDVVGIENVLNDVLLHKKHLEDDKVMTFEKFFSVNENFINVGSPSIEQEKILADLFNTSTGHVDLVDPQSHLFKINDFGDEIYCIIFSKEEISKIQNQLMSKIENEVNNSSISIEKVENHSLMSDIKFWVNDIVDVSKLSENLRSKVSMEMVLSYVQDVCVSHHFDSSIVFKFEEVNGYFIWSHKML